MPSTESLARDEHDGTPAERALVSGIFKGTVQVADAVHAHSILSALVEIAFRGGFSGGGAYFRWKCLSWLDERLAGVIQRCEEVGGKTFQDLVVARTSGVPERGWEYLVDSYLLLPVRTYKQSRRPELPAGAPPEWHTALERLHTAWRAWAFTPRQSVELSRPLEERFGAWVTGGFSSPVHSFGKRPEPAVASRLADLTRALSPALQASATASMRATRRCPFWPRLARRIESETAATRNQD